MRRRITKYSLILFSLLSFAIVQAQQLTCPAIVQEALESIDNNCSDTGRNQACYGHSSLDAQVVGDADFETVGDIASLESIQSLSLNGMDENAGEWGVALMSVQANIPDTLPGQNVTFLLFGNTHIENLNVGLDDDGGQPTQADGNTLVYGNLVNGEISNAEYEQFYTFDAEAGDAVTITMEASSGDLDTYLRLEDAQGNIIAQNDDDDLGELNNFYDSAIRGVTIPETGMYTIVATRFSQEVGTSEGSYTLVLDMGQVTEYPAPMQAFYITSGIGDAGCNEAPESGLIIQTPSGAGEIRMLINEVQVDIGSTVFVQADADDAMQLAVLQGRARVEAFGSAQFVPEGAVVSIPMSHGVASGIPSEPQPYVRGDFLTLPLEALPQQTFMAEPAVSAALTGGEVVITLLWDNNADMDLYLTEPNGNIIYYGDQSSFSGAQLDIDANPACEITQQNEENITWPTGQPRLGTYTVSVDVFDECELPLANWTLTVRIGNEVIINESGTGNAEFTFHR